MTTTPALADHKRIAQGREAEIFEWSDGRVLRLFRTARSPDVLAFERDVMRAVRSAMPNVPEVGEIVEVDGRPGIVMERIDGRDLLTELSTKPWRVFEIGRTAGELQALMHEVVAPATLESQHSRITRRMEAHPHLVPTRVRDIALELLPALPDGDRVCHGDFHPANILRSQRGPVIIDWPNATRGDPLGDFARSRLMMKFGEPPPGTAAWIRAAAKVARRLLSTSYERAYRRERRVDDDLLRRWSIVKAAERLVEDIPSEVPHLIAFVETEYPKL